MITDFILRVFPTIGKRIYNLEEQNDSLKRKLELKQDQINKVNAYWKSKIAGLRQGVRKKS